MRLFTRSQTKRFLAELDRRVASAQAWLETPDGRLLIVKSDYKRHWSVPGGLIDKGETPLQAIQREVMEEVAIDLPLEAFSMALTASRRSDRGLTYQFIFRAAITIDDASDLQLQAAEIQEAAIVTKEQVLSGDRNYGHGIVAWAEDASGYAEFMLE